MADIKVGNMVKVCRLDPNHPEYCPELLLAQGKIGNVWKIVTGASGVDTLAVLEFEDKDIPEGYGYPLESLEQVED